MKFLDKLMFRKNNRFMNKESGNTIVLYIMLFPVVFAAFGLAIDSTVAVFTASSLQSNLDAATQSTLSRSNNPGMEGNKANYPALAAKTAQDTLVNVYDTNRISSKEQPFILCQKSVVRDGGASSPKLVTPSSGCKFTMNSFSYKNAGRKVTVRINIVEQSRPIFLRYVGIEEFTYNLVSESRITFERG